MSHNKQLKQLLTEVGAIAEAAKNENELDGVFEKLRIFRAGNGPIKFDNTAKIICFFAVLVLSAAGGFAAWMMPALLETVLSYSDEYLFVAGIFWAAILIIPVIMMLLSAGEIADVSDTIFRKDVFFDNELTDKKIENGESLYETFHEQFGEFRNRGDEDRYIKRLVWGKYNGKETELAYDYYVFQYVRVYYVPVTHTDSKGNVTVTIERRTETLYRYGIMADFPYVKGIAVVSGGGGGNYGDYTESWQTASDEFNGIFYVYAVDQMTASKFLKPAVVLAFIEMDKYFSGLNVEINGEGRLNIAFSDSDILDIERKHSIADPDEFEKEIKSALVLSKLRTLLDFVGTLKKFNDSNF